MATSADSSALDEIERQASIAVIRGALKEIPHDRLSFFVSQCLRLSGSAVDGESTVGYKALQAAAMVSIVNLQRIISLYLSMWGTVYEQSRFQFTLEHNSHPDMDIANQVILNPALKTDGHANRFDPKHKIFRILLSVGRTPLLAFEKYLNDHRNDFAKSVKSTKQIDTAVQLYFIRNFPEVKLAGQSVQYPPALAAVPRDPTPARRSLSGGAVGDAAGIDVAPYSTNQKTFDIKTMESAEAMLAEGRTDAAQREVRRVISSPFGGDRGLKEWYNDLSRRINNALDRDKK